MLYEVITHGVAPVLAVFADVVGIFGGALVMVGFDIGFVQFFV